MAQPFIAEIRAFGFNFAPYGWAFCDGRLMSIAQNQALFSLVGTTYGGDGQQTFGLPNLQDSAPMHWGNGPGLTPRTIGEVLGTPTVTLTSDQLPSHNHEANVGSPKDAAAAQSTPNSTVLLGSAGFAQAYNNVVSAPPNASFAANAIAPAGGSQAHENTQPILTMNFCIALEGIYPSRN